MVVKYEYKGLQWWKVQRAYPLILTCLMPGTQNTGVPYDDHCYEIYLQFPREDLEQQTYLRFLSKLESVRKTWVGQPSHLVRAELI